MPREYRNQRREQRPPRREHGEEHHLQGSERDRYETGDERRYLPAREDRAYEGDRSYAGGGYAEEFGYRREEQGRENRRERGPSRDYGEREADPGPQRYRSYDERIEGSPGPEYSGPEYSEHPEYGHYQRAGAPYSQGSFVGERYRGHGDVRRMYWPDEREEPGYFGTGGATGVSGTAAGTRALGPSGYLSLGGDLEEWMHRPEPHGSPGRGPSFRGRGPKGYRRTDERLKEMVCEQLTDDPYIDASDVTVEVNDQIVKLTGTVADRRTKYRIEDVIERCGGIQDIDNQLRVAGRMLGDNPRHPARESPTAPEAAAATGPAKRTGPSRRRGSR